jgi:hypothetical protein
LTARTYLDRKRASKLHVAPARVVGERELVDEHRAEAVAIPKHLRQPPEQRAIVWLNPSAAAALLAARQCAQ